MVEDEEEEEEDEEEESGLEYKTNTPSKDSYKTPLSTGGCSKPSLAPSCSPTLVDSDPENNAVLCTKEIEAHIEVFLEEVEEDMEMSDLFLLENVSPLLVPAPIISGFIPFTEYWPALHSAQESSQESLASLPRLRRMMLL